VRARTGNPVDVAVGARIRNLRLRNKLSQEEVGRRLKISFQQVQKYEKGTNRVGASRLSELAKIFGVSVDAFFSEVGGSGSAKDAARRPIDRLTDRHTIRLVEAYEALTDPKLKVAIVELAEQMARCQS
jgi:transcriptional regulator with XRE-family HTH domain